jgi:4-hydroxythreonine-4-phosphate dehydrogenase
LKQRILITCGDVNGIGPELALKVFANKDILERYDIKVIGPKSAFDYYSKLLKLKKLQDKDILSLSVNYDYNLKPGAVDSGAGRISGDAVKLGAELCKKNYFDALVTLPINKESLNLGGYVYGGHTEMLSHLTSSKNTFMLMYSAVLKIVPLTVHIPVKKISSLITKKKLIEKIILINNTFVKTFKIKNPRIAVLSLNPHAGDGGLLGSEEINIINPSIASLLNAGFNIKGPFSADGFFGSTMLKKFDVVLAMFHDQAMIPFKILSKGKGVNFTGGLRILRTSPAHGTAFNIAGKGIADTSSTIEAIRLAGKLSENY